MADKSVGELIAAKSVTPTDLFVLEQNGTAKKLTGQVLENWLVSFADGHGGIQSIAKLSTSGLVDTYRITLADTTTFDFIVTNGKSITNIAKTGTSGLVDTYKISYNDGSSQTYTVTNGAKGDKGDNAYVWIKYASQEPTESSNSIGDIPDNWIGIYSGNASTAPSDWKQYKWYKHKGEKGDTGVPATLANKSVTYQVGDSGSIVPSGMWVSSVPVVPQGKYLWTKTEIQFNTGDPVISYSVTRMGLDGSGSVASVNNVSPDENGNVSLTADNLGALPTTGGDLTGELRMNGQPISGLNEPTEGTQAASKGYVDKRVPLDGSQAMGGNLSMGGNRVTGLAEPEDDGDSATKGYADTKAALPKTASGTVIALSDASDGPLQGLRIYGRTTQDGTPTPDNPVELVSVGDGGTVTVTACGKNLLSNKVEDYTGMTAEVFDGRNCLKWRDDGTNFTYERDFPENTSLTFTLTSYNPGPSHGVFYIYYTDDSKIVIQFLDGWSTHTITTNPSKTVRRLTGSWYNGKMLRLDLDSSQIEIGTTVTAYEPYKEPTTATVTPVDNSRNALYLPGIPVTSGGNYTDADGQQWICDEVDFARGVYVQRIGTIDSYAGEAVSEPYLSTTGALSTGAKVLYVLATPVETPIQEDELVAYAALHTNRPNTTVYNDAGAHMEVGYYPPNATMRQEDIMEYVDAKHFIATVSLPAASWVGDAAPYAQTVPVSGILATDFPHVTPVYSSTLATALAQKEAWSMVNMGVPGAGEITFTCFEDKPTVEIPIQIEVMR